MGNGFCATSHKAIMDNLMVFHRQNFRIIGRLDIKGPDLIKGVHMEGLRVMGVPNEFAKKYYQSGVDELLYIDLVASLYGRSNLADIVSATIDDVFVPITVAGGVRSVEDARRLLKAGADKVAINTAAVERPDLLNEIAMEFGSQCLVLSIEAKKQNESYEVFTDCGRESSGIMLREWVEEAIEKGVGEILLTSIDRDGTMKGVDEALLSSIPEDLDVPIIYSGGFSGVSCLAKCKKANVDGMAIGASLHFDRLELSDVKKFALEIDLPVGKSDEGRNYRYPNK